MLTQVNTLLTKLSIAHRDATEKSLQPAGIHSGQAQVLSVLWQMDGVPQAEICRQLNLSSATVNLLVNKLKIKNFVVCKDCPNDKRLKRVYLSKKGRKIKPEIEKRWYELEEILLSGFSDTEKLLIMMLLEKMTGNLQSHFRQEI